MRKIVLIVMIIGMICMTGCSFIEGEKDEPIEINQKIVLIYNHLGYENLDCSGFYVDSKGNKIPYDFTEIARDFRKKNDFIGIEDIYQLLMETQEADSEEFLTLEEVSKCYRLLSKISDDYEFIRQGHMIYDIGTFTWYGVLDDGVNPPEFIPLSQRGEDPGFNKDKNAKKIMKILNKVE